MNTYDMMHARSNALIASSLDSTKQKILSDLCMRHVMFHIAKELLRDHYLSAEMRIQEMRKIYNILMMDTIKPFHGEIDDDYIESNKQFVKYYKNVKKTLERENATIIECNKKFEKYKEDNKINYKFIKECNTILFDDTDSLGDCSIFAKENAIYKAAAAAVEETETAADYYSPSSEKIKLAMIREYREGISSFIEKMEKTIELQRRTKQNEELYRLTNLKYELCKRAFSWKCGGGGGVLPEDVMHHVREYIGEDFLEKVRRGCCKEKNFGATPNQVRNTIEFMLTGWRVRDLLSYCSQFAFKYDIYGSDYFPSIRKEKKQKIIEFIISRKVIKNECYELLREIAILTPIIENNIEASALAAAAIAAAARRKKTRAESI